MQFPLAEAFFSCSFMWPSLCYQFSDINWKIPLGSSIWKLPLVSDIYSLAVSAENSILTFCYSYTRGIFSPLKIWTWWTKRSGELRFLSLIFRGRSLYYNKETTHSIWNWKLWSPFERCDSTWNVRWAFFPESWPNHAFLIGQWVIELHFL